MFKTILKKFKQCYVGSVLFRKRSDSTLFGHSV